MVGERSAASDCSPLSVPSGGDLAVVGSDASDFACGELVWLDGLREETRLVFTKAERRRPINFRELRGSLRALEVYGERLRGRTVLIELDCLARQHMRPRGSPQALQQS